jgi:hypothetical protein
MKANQKIVTKSLEQILIMHANLKLIIYKITQLRIFCDHLDDRAS